MSFEFKTYGKWILAGEHSVLRGSPALVFPVTHCYMKFNYEVSEEQFSVEFSGQHGKELKLLFWGLIENALSKIGRKRNDLKGRLQLESEIPLGGGMGASAALCVGVGRIWNYLGWVEDSQIYEFSRELENLFHGESSGVDIAAALEGKGIHFLRGGERTPISINWQPNWYLSYCGKRGVTSECVSRVKAIGDRAPELLEKIDREMGSAVSKAEKALTLSAEEGINALASAIDRARDCFRQWKLIEGDLEKHMDKLIENGALAVKPTGSGGGGYVLSLWKSPPSSVEELGLIRL